MTRVVTVAAAQMGPIARDDSRAAVVERLVALLRTAAEPGRRPGGVPRAGADHVLPPLVVRGRRPRPRRLVRDRGARARHEAAVGRGGAARRRLQPGVRRADARRAPVQHRRCSSAPDGDEVGRYRKIHLPGHGEHEPWRPFQHLEKRYFERGDLGLPGVRGVRRPGRDADLQRPPLARGLPGAGAAGRRAGAASATTRRSTTRRRPSTTASATSTTTWSCRRAPTRTARSWSGWPRPGSRRASSTSAGRASSTRRATIVAECTTLGDEVVVAALRPRRHGLVQDDAVRLRPPPPARPVPLARRRRLSPRPVRQPGGGGVPAGGAGARWSTGWAASSWWTAAWWWTWWTALVRSSSWCPPAGRRRFLVGVGRRGRGRRALVGDRGRRGLAVDRHATVAALPVLALPVAARLATVEQRADRRASPARTAGQRTVVDDLEQRHRAQGQHEDDGHGPREAEAVVGQPRQPSPLGGGRRRRRG